MVLDQKRKNPDLVKVERTAHVLVSVSADSYIGTLFSSKAEAEACVSRPSKPGYIGPNGPLT